MPERALIQRLTGILDDVHGVVDRLSGEPALSLERYLAEVLELALIDRIDQMRGRRPVCSGNVSCQSQ